MAATSVPVTPTEPASPEPLAPTSVVSMSALKSQPLWRFALIGLGPLGAMGVFALLLALFQRLG